MSSPPPSTSPAVNPVIIKKYSNRRLYDTLSKRYINLEDLLLLIREGHTIQVLHARSGHDLTQETLHQLIQELRPLTRNLPPPLLCALIRLPDAAWQDLTLRGLPSLLAPPPPPPPSPPPTAAPPANDLDTLRREIEAIKLALLSNPR